MRKFVCSKQKTTAWKLNFTNTKALETTLS